MMPTVDVAPAILIDERERSPWVFEHLPVERGSLSAGDYSVKFLTHLIGIKRKTLCELITCCHLGRQGHARFVRELERLQALRFRCVILETDIATIEAGGWFGALKPSHVIGAITKWAGKYQIPFFFGGTPESSARLAEQFLLHSCETIQEDYWAACALPASFRVEDGNDGV